MAKSRLIIDDFCAYFKKKVTKFGNGAKIDCPKEHLGKEVIVIVNNKS